MNTDGYPETRTVKRTEIPEKNMWRDWVIGEKIGEGASGEIFRIARTEFGQRREAALKIIHVPRDGDEMVQMRQSGMTEQEIRRSLLERVRDLTAELCMLRELGTSSHITACSDYEIGRGDAPGTWRICVQMELLESLDRYQRKHIFCMNEVFCLGIDLSRALEVCEKHQILHRDIKPANIFRTEDGRYKLGDFGISYRCGGEPDGGRLTGTQRYMAPEVLCGGRCTYASDQYALAVVLLEVMAKDIARENGSRTLRRILRKASARSPAKRYASASDFRAALEEAAGKAAGNVSVKRVFLVPAAAAVLVLAAVCGWLPGQEAQANKGTDTESGTAEILTAAEPDAVSGAVALTEDTDAGKTKQAAGNDNTAGKNKSASAKDGTKEDADSTKNARETEDTSADAGDDDTDGKTAVSASDSSAAAGTKTSGSTASTVTGTQSSSSTSTKSSWSESSSSSWSKSSSSSWSSTSDSSSTQSSSTEENEDTGAGGSDESSTSSDDSDAASLSSDTADGADRTGQEAEGDADGADGS